MILRSRGYRDFARSYPAATGMALSLIPTKGRQDGIFTQATGEPELCRLVRRCPAGKAACEAFARKLSGRAASEKRLCSSTCFAGLLEMAFPIFNGEAHAATLLAGRVFKNHQCPTGWQNIAKLIGKSDQREIDRLREAHDAVPIIPCRRFEAASRLLTTFGKTIEERLTSLILSRSANVQPSLLKAYDY
jgi:ligand-binding sensor protein